MQLKQFLHVGCGSKYKDKTTRGLNSEAWREVRFDIDTAAKPDIIGSMTDMSAVKTESMDAIFSSHNIEHVFAHEVPIALSEFHRVLKPEGFAILTCPDLQSVSELVARDKLTDSAYMSPAGPITPLDIIYGHRDSIARGQHYMAHKCGFTASVLVASLKTAGFPITASKRRGPPFFDLWAVALKKPVPRSELKKLASHHFP